MTDRKYKLTIENGLITDIEMFQIKKPISCNSLPDYEEIKACLFVPKEVVGFSDDPEFLESLIGFDPLAIEVEDGNKVYEARLNCLIRKEDKTMVLGCRNSFIPENGSVEHIGSCVLCAPIIPEEIDLSCFEIPEGVKTIGYRAFANSSDADIHIVVPDSVEKIEAMAFMMNPGEDSDCSITFYGSPELEAGVFGTKVESIDSDHEAYKNLPEILYVNPEKLTIRGLKNSTVERYCKKYGIRFEVLDNFYRKVIAEVFGNNDVTIDFNDDFYLAFDKMFYCLTPDERKIVKAVYLKGTLHRALRKMRNPKRFKEIKAYVECND